MALATSGGAGEAMLCRITQSHWKEGEMVPTYFVSQKPRKGHFQRLKDALQQAPMYSRIEIVGGGTFREKVVIDKPVEIGVAKAAEMPTIANKGTGVVCQADEALLEGVRIESEDSSTPCLTIVRGSPKIRWCVMQAVEVSGTASPTIEECKLLESKTHGLFLTDRASGTYTKNSIWGHSGYSVLLESCAEPTLSYNVIAGSEMGQVCIQDDADVPGRVAPYLLLNRISDDKEVSVETSGGAGGGPADAFAKANTTTSSSNTVNEHGVLPAHKLHALPVKRVGMKVAILPSQHVSVYDADLEEETSDDPTLMENVTAQHCAVLVTGSHTHPTLVRNTIASCKHHGITIKASAGGVYETNYVSANKGWGVVVQGDTTAPVMKANHIGNNGGGMRIFGSPVSLTDGNTFFGNRGPQLLVHNGHPRFVCESSSVKSGNRTGVLCVGTGTGTFRRNHFEGCAIAARVESLADPSFDHDVFEQCRIGAYVREGGLGHFVGCHFTDVILYGALVMTLGRPLFQGCQFVFNEIGAVLMRRGRGTFEGCCFRDCRECGVDVSTESHPVVTHCEVKACQRGGVRVRLNGRGEYLQNLLVRNRDVQLLVSEGGDPVVTANVLGFSESDGVRVVNGGLGTFVRNVVQSCYDNGVVVVGKTTAPVIRANQISECGMSGLQLTNGHRGTYEKNVITRCCRACISVEGYALDSHGHADDTADRGGDGTDGAQPSSSTGAENDHRASKRDGASSPVVLRRNLLYHTSGCGVIAERRAAVLLHQCAFRHHQQGIAVRGGSDVVVIACTLRDCTHGVCADEESALQLFKNVFISLRGTAVTSLSTSLLQVRANAFTHCGTALLLRRVSRGVCLENTVRHSALYGIFLGTDCRCVVTRNILFDDRVGISFSELHNHATVVDNCIVRASEQGIRVAGDAMDKAQCRLNVVLAAKVGLFLRLGCLKMECNLVLNCEEGLHVSAAPGKGATSAGAAALFGASSDTFASGASTGAKRAPPKLGGHASPHHDLVQAGGGAGALVRYGYVSGCSRGGTADLGGGSVVQVERTLFSHNDVGFHVNGARASLVLLRGTIFSNSAAAGLYTQACPGTPCVLDGCMLFKNYINVVCVQGAAPELRRCVMEAPVVFNVFISGVRTAPRFVSCLICPRAGLANQAASVAPKATFNQQQQASLPGHRGDDRDRSQAVETLLREVVDQHACIVDPAMTATRGSWGVASGGVRGVRAQSEVPQECQGEAGATRSPRLAVTSSAVSQWLVTPSLWMDHYSEPPAWQKSAECERSLEETLQHLETDRGKLRAELLVRRSAILWPANVEDEDTLGGPGGPFIVHRMRLRTDGARLRNQPPGSSGDADADDENGDGAQASVPLGQRHHVVDARHREDYLYSCSGLWLEHAATPQLEGCYIGEHASVGTGFDRPVALPEDYGWSLSVLRFLGDSRGVTTTAAVAADAQSSGREFRSALTAPYVPPLPEVSTDTLLGQLLHVGSPCFWRQHATTPHFFHEHCSLLAESMSDPVSQLVRKRQFDHFSTSAIHFGAGFTARLVGTGVFARHYAEGDFLSCTLARNTTACRLSMGAKTCFKGCQLTANTGEAVVLDGRCVASILNCTFREGRHTQITVLGVATAPAIKHNTFHGTAVTAIAVRQQASPSIVSNQFTSVQSAAVVVDSEAAPFLEKNQFDYCQCGIEYCGAAGGRLERNHFKGSTTVAVRISDAGTAPAVVGNTIVDARVAALQVVGDGAAPYVEDNTLSTNDVGIWVQGGAQGTYLRNTLRKHRQGIVVEDSQGYFRGNTVAETLLEGVLARGAHCAPVLVANRVQGGEAVGVRWEGAQGQLARNRVLHNAEDGCAIAGSSACPVLIANEVAHNGGAGVCVSGGSVPVLRCNVIIANTHGGVSVQDNDTKPTLEGDYIKGNHAYGVLFGAKTQGRLSACVVSATVDGPAIAIDDGALPTLQETAIVDNTAGGVVVRSGAHLHAARCLFAHNEGGGAALVVQSSEDGTCLAGCLFLENDLSVLVQRGAKAELTACGFLGVHASSAAVRIQSEATPLFTHCLFASTRCGVFEEGAGRYTRCMFMECTTGAEVSGPSMFYECECLECGTGLRVVGGSASIMGCILASCAKVGLHLTGGAQPSVGECGLLRNLRGLLADGSAAGTVNASRILWNTDNVVINDQATTTLTANLIYDGVNSGVLVRGGAPTIAGNDIFDNHYAGVTVESASGGRLEDNRISFAREDGALVVRNEKESLTVSANTLRNSSSPPANSQFRNANERQLGYRKLGVEKEKDSVTFAALRSFLEEAVCLAALRISVLQAHTVAAASNKEWLVSDKEAPPESAAANAPAPSSGRSTKSAGRAGATSAEGEGNLLNTESPASEEPVSRSFEPLFTRWEKLSADAAAAARTVDFAHASVPASGTPRDWPLHTPTAAEEPLPSAPTSPAVSGCLGGGVSPRVAATGENGVTLPPINTGPPAARRVTREGPPSLNAKLAARRGSHVDAVDETAITSSHSSSSSLTLRRAMHRPTTRAGEGPGRGETEALLLPAAAALVVLFHTKRALQKQLDQLQGTPNTTPSHLYTAVLHRPMLQTVSSTLDSDAFRAVFDLQRSVSTAGPVPTKAARLASRKEEKSRRTQSVTGAAGTGTTAAPPPTKKRKGSSVVRSSGDSAAALRLPSIAGGRGVQRASAASAASGSAAVSPRRVRRGKRKSTSTVLGDSPTRKPRSRKRKSAG